MADGRPSDTSADSSRSPLTCPGIPKCRYDRLKSSRVLEIERFSDFSEFRANEVLGLGTSTPLRPREFSLSRAILPLQNGLFVLQRAFARRLRPMIGTDSGIGLVVPLSFHSITNGREVDSSTIAVMRGKVPVGFDRASTQHLPHAALQLGHASSRLGRFRHGPLPMSARRTIRWRACAPLSWRCSRWPRHAALPASSRRSTARSRKHCSQASTPPWCRRSARTARPGSFDRHRKLIAQLDEVVELFGSKPLYSDDLAKHSACPRGRSRSRRRRCTA